ncbi:hypothetical protein [Candidatus Similichlamydia laticola]|uniref:Uncharacterized protein n=1 Tax=Candidatus Similichlamydia laticola TaxID=2170265 RepID=A0A369KBF7_9BACT|nr:hypothetical protein [Candidatus Similichlamydia laticola]RDB31248.1 hypothetical protein HAT2_00649 [Candidatus Similichlamydia laticola]
MTPSRHLARRLSASRALAQKSVTEETPAQSTDPKTAQKRLEQAAPGGPGEISAQVTEAELFQNLEQEHQTTLDELAKENQQMLAGLQNSHLGLLDRIRASKPSLASHLHQQHQDSMRQIQEQHIEGMKRMKQAHAAFLSTLQEKSSSASEI